MENQLQLDNRVLCPRNTLSLCFAKSRIQTLPIPIIPLSPQLHLSSAASNTHQVPLINTEACVKYLTFPWKDSNDLTNISSHSAPLQPTHASKNKHRRARLPLGSCRCRSEGKQAVVFSMEASPNLRHHGTGQPPTWEPAASVGSNWQFSQVCM